MAMSLAPQGSLDDQTSIMTVRDAVIDFARRVGMTTIFANPGSTELPMFRDFPADFRYVLGLQEAVVVGMADGHAQASGRATLVNLHSAAGVGNAMGNIFTAFRNRTPLVITAGQQARSILPFDPFLSATDATELPKPYVKWSIEPARAQDVPLAIARAWAIAMQEPRGPVFVSIPVDDWDQPTQRLPERAVSHVTRPDPDALASIGTRLAIWAACAWTSKPTGRGWRGARSRSRRSSSGCSSRSSRTASACRRGARSSTASGASTAAR